MDPFADSDHEIEWLATPVDASLDDNRPDAGMSFIDAVRGVAVTTGMVGRTLVGRSPGRSRRSG
jgi:hypothetical protein